MRAIDVELERHDSEFGIRHLDGVGIKTVPYEGRGMTSGGVKFTAEHSGPGYTIFEGNDIEATYGYFNDRLIFSGGDPYGNARVAEGDIENLVFYKNTFDSGNASAGVKMSFSLITNFADLVSGYPSGQGPGHPSEGDSDATIPDGFRFFVFHGNTYLSDGTTTYAPVFDFGDPLHPDYTPDLGKLIVAPLPTMHLIVLENEQNNFTFRVWNAGVVNDDIDSVTPSVSWLSVSSIMPGVNDSYFDIEFEVDSNSLSAGEETGVFTVVSDSGLSIDLSVFLRITTAL